MTKISIIVPCYNEAESLLAFYQESERVRELLIGCDFEYTFINDGSTDRTLAILRDLQLKNPEQVHYISFSRNFGKEAAIYAGLLEGTGDYISFLDADLQDPPELLVEMYEKIQDPEVDCVAARRTDRVGESWLISTLSRLFYWLMNKVSDTPVISGVRDYRLMSRQMKEAVVELSEYNRFSKGLFSWVGFTTIYIDYHNVARAAGQTKWGLMARTRYAIDGFVNFSEAPLDVATYGGLAVVSFDILAVLFIIFRRLIFGDPVGGWTSTIVIILFTFGVTLTMLGVIGKYIAKIFMEVKKRPIYIIKEKK